MGKYALIFGLIGLANATPGQAEPQRSTSVAIERIVGYSILTIDASGSSEDLRTLSLGGTAFSPLAAPRLGVDYRVGDQFMFGGAVAWSSAAVDDVDATYFLGQVRAGYCAQVTPSALFIPRVGLGRASIELADNRSAESLSGTVLTLEAIGRFDIAPGFFVLSGLSYDTVISGEFEQDREDFFGDSASRSDDLDASITSLQLWFGLGGAL